MSDEPPLTVICLSSSEKGHAFIRECRAQGCYVILLTRDKWAHATWPWESIDQLETLPSLDEWTEVMAVVNRLARDRHIDRIAALDDFDVECAAMMREHLRMPGMSYSTSRRFRDKLAMRVAAAEHGIVVPDFVHTLNAADIAAFVERVPPPWILKPRGEAAAVGIRKIESADLLWSALNELDDRHPYFLVEQYVPGDIFHVDSIVSERDVVFALPSRYGKPPFDVAHGGGIFTTRTLAPESGDAQTLRALNRDLIQGLGLVRGVTHTEFIRSHEHGQFYFLETAPRVGGANIAELVEAASGINLWQEWARIDLSEGRFGYELPEQLDRRAGIIISLAHQQHPDTSAFDDPEIVWRLQKDYHAGLIVASDSNERVEELLESYSRRFVEDFTVTLPAPDSLRT
ncbi:MAG: ATPase [Acidobacteria bacterium]|nr:ATPase [Acidobacteriota bacterium]